MTVLTMFCLLGAVAPGQEALPAAAALDMPGGHGLGVCVWAQEAAGAPVRLYVRGGMHPWGWGLVLNDQPIMLGEVQLPGAKDPAVSTVHSDAVSRTYRLAGGQAGPAANLTVNRLSPAIMIELEGRQLDLFAGDKKTRWGWRRERDALFSKLHEYDYPIKTRWESTRAGSRKSAG